MKFALRLINSYLQLVRLLHRHVDRLRHVVTQELLTMFISEYLFTNVPEGLIFIITKILKLGVMNHGKTK